MPVVVCREEGLRLALRAPRRGRSFLACWTKCDFGSLGGDGYQETKTGGPSREVVLSNQTGEAELEKEVVSPKAAKWHWQQVTFKNNEGE